MPSDPITGEKDKDDDNEEDLEGRRGVYTYFLLNRLLIPRNSLKGVDREGGLHDPVTGCLVGTHLHRLILLAYEKKERTLKLNNMINLSKSSSDIAVSGILQDLNSWINRYEIDNRENNRMTLSPTISPDFSLGYLVSVLY